MKFCTHCGNQLVDDAVICPQCGCAAEDLKPANSQSNSGSLSTLAIVGFVFAFIGPLIGLICSIIAYRNANAEGDIKSKNFARTGIIISAVILGVELVIEIICIAVTLAAIGAAAAGGALGALALVI